MRVKLNFFDTRISEQQLIRQLVPLHKKMTAV